MDNLVPLLIGGSLGLISITAGSMIAYRSFTLSRASIKSKIDQAERELRHDIVQIGVAELEKTVAGRNLLRTRGLLIEESDDALEILRKQLEVSRLQREALASKQPASSEEAPDFESLDFELKTEQANYQFTSALSEYVDELMKIGRFKEARVLLVEALDIDPLREDLHRKMMLCLIRLGDRYGAIKHFQHMQELVRAELGEYAPSEEMRALYTQLVSKRVT